MGEVVKTIKCVVWDLDNTLWEGTLLEDRDVILLDSRRAIIETLDARGVLQSIASKNNFDEAWSRLEDLGIAEYFILPQIGWGPKSASVRNLIDKLNFSENVIAFIDDQPVERAEVNFHLPDVRCYSPEKLDTLLGFREFNPINVTSDAKHRRKMYQAGFERDAAREEFNGPDEEFLRSLELELQIDRADSGSLARVEELTLRTSQMNATGIHYSESALRELSEEAAHDVLVASLDDRYGTYGAIGVVLLERKAEYWHLKLLATSCRVVSLGIGSTILNWIVDRAAHSKVHLIADFRRTERNRMMEIAYRFTGFSDAECVCLEGLPNCDDTLTRFHLTPEERPLSPTVRLDAPDLAPVINKRT